MGEVTDIAKALGDQVGSPSPLTPLHDLSRFKSGKDPLDDWLRHRARKSEGVSARTYIVAQGHVAVGYYSIAMGGVARNNTPRKIKQNAPDPVPVGILARLAVDTRFRGQGIGAGLLKDALLRIMQASEILGARAVLVHAIDEEAVKFYTKYGFIEFPLGSQTMFLPFSTLVDAL